ncbi:MULTISPECIES: MFS transporter [unclassified Mesorhizobium]|uniref:MFS transporter n=3 Tax=Mesorhizobium TaxID=68287 RepID=UPI000FD27B75|nr:MULTISPECIES: MFS transporter [unclassified Mesorhizobium]RUV82793.1 MFS transporter [Mesorhizobium sp. M1A.F.Ca.IN.020.32.1.1]RWG07023.1 MAG: MFS transporter [Mesorhizobium sp.]RWG92626.1 MAG: MFS transporter [Mesorhizobium sp.]RWH07788.1 MAG: MFS transporter [Mesorhizobium sp.]RWH11394.1 MAG: MFS transporter [Mesorhizobium sp.]
MSRVVRADAASVSSATFAPLENPTFRAVWLFAQVSSLGWLFQSVAVSWLMATISTSDVMVALVQASTTLPVFLLSIFAGAIADNFSRRHVMAIGWCVIALSSIMLTALVALGYFNPWMILAFSCLAGCGAAFTDPAWHASVGDILRKREVPAAVTLISVGYNAMRSIGPALGGVIVASFGPLTAFALATLTYFAMLWAIGVCKWSGRSSPLPREPLTTAIHDGARFTALSGEIKAAIARGTLFGLTSISILALLPLVARDQLGGGPIVYGVLMAGFGAGALCAGISNNALRRALSQERLTTLACISCAACCLALAFTPSIVVATIALTLGGAGWVVTWTGLDVSVQLSSPRWVVGRTLSIYSALASGGIAAGSWLWGVVAENYSLTLALESSAGALLLVAATGLLLPIRQWKESDQDSLGFETPQLALDLKSRSGPIVVKIEYAIPEDKVEEFLDQMRERRRVQSRAGARHWNLQRDLQEPVHWTETFRTPTWMDYLRLNHRLTSVDKELDQRLRELHAGGLPPRTRLAIERPTGATRRREQSTGFFFRR